MGNDNALTPCAPTPNPFAAIQLLPLVSTPAAGENECGSPAVVEKAADAENKECEASKETDEEQEMDEKADESSADKEEVDSLENVETVFTSESALFALEGHWVELGKGEVKVNVSGAQKARLVMRDCGNNRLILNANLYPEMRLIVMDKKSVIFGCRNANEERRMTRVLTFALKFKEASIMETFCTVVAAYKVRICPPELKTTENSLKAAEE